MAYQSMDRPRYVVPALGGIYAALETYSWPLVRAATGFFFLPHGMQKLFGFWGAILPGPSRGLPSKVCTPLGSGPTTSGPWSSSAGFA